MKKTSLKKLLLLFSFIALSAYGVVLACADYFVEYDYDSSFTPETYVDKSYSPLFFSSQDVFYGIGFDEGHTSRFNNDILADWQTYLAGKLTREQLNFFLLNDSASALIPMIYTAIQKNQKPVITPSAYNTLNVTDVKIKSFFEFMHYAKEIELSSTTSSSSWNYDEAKETPMVNPKTIAQVEKLFTEAKDSFLKNRYWFQAMKGYFYSNDKQSIIAFFEKTKSNVPQNTLYYRGVAYVAGAYYSAKNYAMSNYLYSVVFDKCPELRTVAAYNFHPQEQADFQASLTLAKTSDEKSALWALYGYHADEKEAIREIYKLSPLSTHLDYLLTRLVNKEEVRLNSIAFKSADDYKKSIKAQADKDVLQLVNTIAKEAITSKPYLWNVAAGYLNILTGNNVLAAQFLDKAEKQTPKEKMASNQLRLMKLINSLYSISKIGEREENILLPELDWLYHKLENESTFRYHHALNWSKMYIASLYKNQQSLVMGELFNRNGEFYRTQANIDAIKKFLQKPVKTEWEKLAISIYNVTLSDIFEYQSVMSAYKEKLDDAIGYMEQSAKGKTIPLPGNPFNGKIKDCHDCDHAAPQKITYTKLSLLTKMKEMQDHLDKGEDVYNNSLLLGNAYYNMSYYGNARVFYYGTIMGQDGSNYIDPYYQPQLLNSSTASQYYQRAFNAASNDEQRAKCTYMMAKCERNVFYTEKYYSRDDFYGDVEVSFLAWNGFKKLKTEYANTKYYKEVLNECGYFSTYVGAH